MIAMVIMLIAKKTAPSLSCLLAAGKQHICALPPPSGMEFETECYSRVDLPPYDWCCISVMSASSTFPL